MQEIIKKDEECGALRASLKRANDAAAASADEAAFLQTEITAIRKELEEAADGAREEDDEEAVLFCSVWWQSSWKLNIDLFSCSWNWMTSLCLVYEL